MIDAAVIASAVGDGVVRAASQMRPDVFRALGAALASERSERGRAVLGQLIENAEIASRDRVPVCQDTGTVWVWVEIGQDEPPLAELQRHVDTAVSSAYRTAGLRMSVARDALFDRTNTGDNTPAFIDVSVRPGSGATVHVMLKGGGSDNASALAMLDPSAGEAGVMDFVLERVAAKASSACPPLVLGLAVGGTFDTAPKLAKKALLRPLDAANPDARAAQFERTLLARVNALGIGPAGLGGDTTALAVSLVTAPCHIAALPVALNMGCNAVRSVSIDVV